MSLLAKIFLTCFIMFIANIFAIGFCYEAGWTDYKYVAYILIGIFVTSPIGMLVTGLWCLWSQ